MKINRENYEIFFIDYLDGSLSDDQIKDLESFLLINPDLKEELEGLERAILIPQNLSFPEKNSLYRSSLSTKLSEKNFEDHCIAYLEGDLDQNQIAVFEKLIENNPDLKNEFLKYQNTILKKDLSIIFPDKSSLKKKVLPLGSAVIYPALSAVAAILIFLIIFRWNYHSDIPLSAEPETIAVNKAPYVNDAPYVNEEADPSFTEQRDNVLITYSSSTKTESKKNVESTQNLPQSLTEEKDYRENSFSVNSDLTIIISAIDHPLPEVTKAIPDQIQNLAYFSKDNSIRNSLNTASEYHGIKDLALGYINNRIFENEIALSGLKQIKMWDIAEAGIKGFNKLTGSELKLEKELKDNGEIMAINFDAGFFGFSRSKK